MERDQNPALGSRGTKGKHKHTPHPTLLWEQLPQFFVESEGNKANELVVTLCALKVAFMTFLLASALSGMRWEEWDPYQDLWVIPGVRMKYGDAHLIIMTDPLREVLQTLRQLGTGNGYVFPSPRGVSKGHMNPSSMNQHLVRLGYRGVLNAHGIRAILMTAGQEVLGFTAEIIQRQLSHSIGDKIRMVYDRSEMLDERRGFMVSWCDALLAQGLQV